MKRRLLTLLLITPAYLASPAHAIDTPWGHEGEPVYPSVVCEVLEARLDSATIDQYDADGRDTHPDTARIQKAIDSCQSGAVQLMTSDNGRHDAFLSGPITLKSRVTLWIDHGATLFASRDPADYDKGQGDCGTANTSSVKSCRSLIEGKDLYDSGLVGEGRIDGRGGSLLLSGPNAGKRSWWDVAYQSKQGLIQHNFRLVQIDGGSKFVLRDLTLVNSPNFHIVVQDMDFVTAWGIRILTPTARYTQPGYACPNGTTPDKLTPATCFTPETVKNTDGFDPGQSNYVILAKSYISTGDDNVAIKSKRTRPSQNQAYVDNWFYYGHGMSIGSETDSGVDDIWINGLVMDGMDSPGGNGLRVKSDSSRGGKVTRVSFNEICMRNMRNPIVLDTAYSDKTGDLIPDFADVSISNFHYTGSTAFGGGTVVFRGYNADHPLRVNMFNVVFDGAQPRLTGSHNPDTPEPPRFTEFTLGHVGTSFDAVLKDENGSTVGQEIILTEGALPEVKTRDCSHAFKSLKSVLPDSPF